MENKQDTIEFIAEDGSKVSFFVLEQIKITGTNYILVTDSDEGNDEESAYILKEIREENGQNIYEIVEKDEELIAISKVFEEILDNIEVKYPAENNK